MNKIQRIFITMFLGVFITTSMAQIPLSSDFTYQGELVYQDQLVDGAYDFRVSIYDAEENGNQLGTTLDIEDVLVNQGIFVLNLDFGDSAFIGHEVFLEIEVRENDSGALYDILTPRQKISNTPYAIHAQFVGVNAVSSEEIQDGSVTNNDLADNSVTTNKIAPGAIGESDVNTTKIQLRISQSCPTDEFIQSVNADGTVVCDTIDTEVGDVTSEEIVDGTIQTIDLADDVIGLNQMQDNAVGSNEIINNSIENSDLANDSISSDNIMADAVGNSEMADNAIGLDEMQDNSVGSNEIINGSIQSFDMGINSIAASHIVSNAVGSDEIAANAVGSSEIASNAVGSSEIASNAVGSSEIQNGAVGADEVDDSEVQLRISGNCADGFYLKGIGQDGGVICERLSSDFDDILKNGSFVGAYNSIAMGSNGNPVVAYYSGGPNTSLWILVCGNSICSTGNSHHLIDNSASVGRHNSVTIDAIGMPIISYHNSTTDDLKFARCGNATCSSGNTNVTLDSVAQVGEYTSIALGSDNLPIISYYDESNLDLKVVHCGNANCSSGNTITTVDSSAQVGKYNDLAIGSDDLPIISYFDEWNGDLKVILCGNFACSSGNSINTLASTGVTGLYTSIAIGADGDPIIAYYDQTNDEVKTVKCGNTACTSGNVYNDAGPTNSTSSIQIAIGDDGNPVISYNYAASGVSDVLVVTKCYDQSCQLNYQSLLLPTLNHLGIDHDMIISSDGYPVISYGNNALSLRVHACGNPGCF